MGTYHAAKNMLAKRAARFLVVLALALLLFPATALASEASDSSTSASQQAIAAAGQRYQTLSDAGESKQSNLVLFVKFKDDTSTVLNDAYIYSGEHDASGTPGTEGYVGANHLHYSNYQYLKDDFNVGSYGRSSLQAYLTMASNGQYTVTSYFPQESDQATLTNSSGEQFTADQVAYIQLDKTEAEYRSLNSDESLVSAVFEKFNAAYPTYATNHPGYLDADGDGSIDNISFVFQLQTAPSSQDDVFWPHMWSESSLQSTYKIGSEELSTYNFLYTYATPDDTQKISLGISPGVTVHEYLHTLGLQDYYNNTLQKNGGSPVSPWDIMADKSYNYFLLSNTRELLGWTSVPDISQAGTSKTTNADGSTTYACTLYKPFSSSGNQSFELYTSMNSSEHFVFEYRQKTDISNNPLQPDSSLHINNSGLIIYRVNDSVTSKSNFNDADGFYTYVFRPGETGANVGGGNTFESTLETSQYAASGLTYGTRTSFGSSDLSTTPASSTSAGTIYYADGSNSGVTVQVTDQTDDSISFNVTVPNYSSLGLWDAVGPSAGAGSTGETSMAVGPDGVIYQAYRNNDTGAISVRSWDGDTWKSLGTVATGSTTYAPKLKMAGSTLYCVYANFQGGSSNTVECKKWSGSAWAASGTIKTGSSYCYLPTPASIDGSLCVLVDKDDTTAQLYRLSDTAFSMVGNTLQTSGILTPSLISANGKTYVVCGDYNYSDSSTKGLKIYQLNGGLWQSVYNNGAQWARPTAAVAVGTSLIAFSSEDSDNAKKIVEISSDGTSKSYPFDKVTGSITSANLYTVGGNVYLTVLTGTGEASTWYAPQSDLSSWKQLGANAHDKATSMDAVSDGKNMYVGVATNDTSAAAVVSHSLAAATPTPTITHTITASAGTGGSISPDGATTVTEGSSQTYTITPTSGYAISDVQVDGTSQGAIGSYTFSNVAADHTISATFVSTTPTTPGDLAVSTTTHVQNIGWQSPVSSTSAIVAAGGGISGTSGRALRLEGIKINVSDASGAAVSNAITYSTHVQNIGWQGYVNQGEMSGTTGKAYRLEAIRIKLTSAYSSNYDVYYRVHAQNIGWMDWASNGEEAGTAGYAYRLEAIQIIIVKKGVTPPSALPAKKTTEHFESLKYRSYLQNSGWKGYVFEGRTSGTTKSLRVEALRISLGTSEYSGSVKYRVYVAGSGWQAWKANGKTAGTTGKGKQLGALQVKLTGAMASHYDVYYRVRIAGKGWTGWKKDGATAGKANSRTKITAYQVKLVPR